MACPKPERLHFACYWAKNNSNNYMKYRVLKWTVSLSQSHMLVVGLSFDDRLTFYMFTCASGAFSAPFSSPRKRNITTIIVWNIVYFNKLWASHMLVFIWLAFGDRLAFYMFHWYLVRSVTCWLKGSMSSQLVQPSVFRTSNSLVMKLSEAAFVVCHHKTNVVWCRLRLASAYKLVPFFAGNNK
jgi:hypothetical protein